VFSTILVPTDFSQESASALKVAAALAAQTEAQVLLLHVVDSLLYKSLWATEEIGWHKKQVPNTQQALAQQITQEVKQKLIHFTALHAASLIVQPCIAFQNIYTAIEQYAKKNTSCLIVMGSKGTGETSFLVGSNTEKIIRSSAAPVWVVKENKPFMLKNICFASDFQDFPATAMHTIKQLQQLFGATLHLLKVITPQHFELSSHTKQSLNSFAALHKLSNYTTNIYNHYTEHEGILCFAEETKVDLICMATNGNTGFMQILMGSIAEDVANYAKIAVLTFKMS
jgi:nucleotide-binding universal stress UspA family protein